MKKDGNRPLRVAELVKRELAALIPRTLDDPRTHQTTITYVDMSPDLKSARVYFTLLGGEAAAELLAEVCRKLDTSVDFTDR